MNLRQRIRKDKICCKPWKQYRGEIQRLPISSQCLFANDGIPWDVLEMELRSERMLAEDENLWDALADINRLMLDEKSEEEIWDETWTDEDFKELYRRL